MDSVDFTGNQEADGLYKVTKKSDYSVRLKLQRKVTVTELTQVISVSTQRRAKKHSQVVSDITNATVEGS